MEGVPTDTMLSVGVVGSFVVGIGFIVGGGATIAIIGVVLIILSVVLFFPRMKNFLDNQHERA